MSQNQGEAHIAVATMIRHRMQQQAIDRVLDLHKRIRVVLEVSHSQHSIDKILQTTPDVAVIETTHHRPEYYDYLRILATNNPRLPLVALSTSDHQLCMNAAFRSGAVGFVTTDADPEELVQAIYAVAEGELYCQVDMELPEPHQSRRLAPKQHDPNSIETRLSVREQQILRLTSEGHTSREIGKILHISHRTVEGHWQSLRDKMNARNKASLIKRAYELGVLT